MGRVLFTLTTRAANLGGFYSGRARLAGPGFTRAAGRVYPQPKRSTVNTEIKNLTKFLILKFYDNTIKVCFKGCGKTMMMDMVFGLMPETKLKQRIHFNKFMLSIHDRIYKIKNAENKDPNQDDFDILAQEVMSEVNVIFFDEFQVTDIADAMLMSRLFTALFNNGLILFCTSNREPNELYKNGLQRDLFLPFIDILRKYCDIICLDSPTDYRKESKMSSKRIYFHSDSETHLINKLVSELINEQDGLSITENLDNLYKLKSSTIEVLGRNIVLEKSYKRLLETDFSFLCKEARGARDYLEFCKLFDVIILRDIPVIDINDPNSLRRFIVFIDTVYDNKIKLVCSGKASTIFTLFDFAAFQKNKVKSNATQVAKKEMSSYSGLEEEIFAVDRTISRLIEMQSETYNNATNKK